MTTKTDAAGAKQDEKYRSLIEGVLRELKQLQKEILREREKGDRFRAESRRIGKDTEEVLRRVEATL
jgi:hypothetical protein